MLIYKCCDHFSNINTRKTKKISPGNEKMLTKQRKVVKSQSHTIIIKKCGYCDFLPNKSK